MELTHYPRPALRILEFARERPEQSALAIDGEEWSYGELLNAARQIAARFTGPAAGERQAINAILANRHPSTYAAILATRLSGGAYVPINTSHPPERNAKILERSGASRVICGDLARDDLAELFAACHFDPEPEVISCGDTKRDYDGLAQAAPDFPTPQRPTEQNDLAYILFTSGSTGTPKGVPIGNQQLESYLAATRSMLDVGPQDRCSQAFELNFDVSVHDLFVSWESGATLVVPSEREIKAPARYIREQNLTCWFSVPSMAYQIRLQEELTQGSFPSLRLSFFIGEALPETLAREWAAAAPQSRIENWYGPTEATIAASRYVWGADSTGEEIVPIGKALPEMELLVLNSDQSPCADDEPGELFLAGPQLAQGYLNDPEKTTESFFTLSSNGRPVYRTGDRAARRRDGNIVFLGRVDNQVKVRGYRIELSEVEGALRSASGGVNAVALAWPTDASIATSIVGVLECAEMNTQEVSDRLTSLLPDYMIPASIMCRPHFPTNASGKVDRLALAETLRDGTIHAPPHHHEPLPAQGQELLACIQRHAPLLHPKDVLNARNLFEAGMDSLSFVGLTTDLEHQFGLALDETAVVALADMSFDEIRAEIRGEKRRLSQATAAKVPLQERVARLFRIPRIIRKPRANRALQFIERFPDRLAQEPAASAIAVGSSCVFRSFHPESFSEVAQSYGCTGPALNVGLPGITLSSLTRICEFIRDECVRAGTRPPIIIYELDLMSLSTKPPRGDIELTDDYFSGNVLSLRTGKAHPEFEWLPSSNGEWNASAAARPRTRKPNWARVRDEEIAQTYLGDFAPVNAAVEHWLRGASALQEVTDQLVGFLHPADRTMLNELAQAHSKKGVQDFLAVAAKRAGLEILPWEDFALSGEDFLDINHMNSETGRQTLSRQLAQMLFAHGPAE